jgi:hypothetical protein
MVKEGTMCLVSRKFSWLGVGFYGIKEIEPSLMVMIQICKSLCFFKDVFILIRHKAKPSMKEGMSQWLDSL